MHTNDHAAAHRLDHNSAPEPDGAKEAFSFAVVQEAPTKAQSESSQQTGNGFGMAILLLCFVALVGGFAIAGMSGDSGKADRQPRSLSNLMLGGLRVEGYLQALPREPRRGHVHRREHGNGADTGEQLRFQQATSLSKSEAELMSLAENAVFSETPDVQPASKAIGEPCFWDSDCTSVHCNKESWPA